MKTSVLIVEDTKGIRESLAEILDLNGYDVTAVEKGEEGLAECEKRSFKVALLDIKLPDMEGTDLLKILREKNPRMINIMITGFPSLRNATLALNMGADAYIMKPVVPDDLMRVIEEKLKNRSKPVT